MTGRLLTLTYDALDATGAAGLLQIDFDADARPRGVRIVPSDAPDARNVSTFWLDRAKALSEALEAVPIDALAERHGALTALGMLVHAVAAIQRREAEAIRCAFAAVGAA